MIQGKKLSARRGSVSAPDPQGKHAYLNDDPNRSSSSTLTIVRIVDLATSPATPGFVTPFNLSDTPSSPTHSSRRSIRRHGSTSSTTTTENRLSFAFSSFSPVSPTQPSSPFSSSNPQTQSSRTGSSPSSSPRLRPSSPQFTRRHSASGSTSAFSKPNLSPEQLVELARHSTTPRYVPSTPIVHPPQPAANSSSPITGFVASPATFTLLPEDVYLPFIDRAAETAHLISTPPTMKLFSLLAQTFPSQVPHEEIQDPFVVDPSRWSFNTLRRWLTDVDRSTANDALWVKQARKCVRAHSELIWERLKGALGVPPELELDETDEASGFIDPTVEESTLPHLTPGHVQHDVDIEHHSPTQAPHDPEQALTIEPIIATSSSNPPQSSQGTSNPPPSSLPPVLSQSAQSEQGLQDIVEDLEEEEAEVEVVDGDRAKSHTEREAQIHGLRVCTSPVPTFSSITAHVSSYPPSPAVDMNTSGRDSIEPHTPEFFLPPLTRRLSRTSSHGSVSSIGRPASGSYTYRDAGHNSGASEIGDSESERGYDPVGDRAPGNPLFPSNFARLALGPTLRANNPSLRSSHGTIPRWVRWAPGGRPPSWAEAWDAGKQEYATSVTSVSSIGGGE